MAVGCIGRLHQTNDATGAKSPRTHAELYGNQYERPTDA